MNDTSNKGRKFTAGKRLLTPWGSNFELRERTAPQRKLIKSRVIIIYREYCIRKSFS
jgi:hypothetical protein